MADPDNTEISIDVIDESSELAGCNCFKHYESSRSIVMNMPEDWPESVDSDTFVVTLSHEKDTKTYQIPVRVVFNIIGINNRQELLINPETSSEETS